MRTTDRNLLDSSGPDEWVHTDLWLVADDPARPVASVVDAGGCADSGPSSAAYHRGVVIVILVLVVLALGVVLAVLVSRTGVPGVEDAVNTQSFAGLAQGPVQAQDVGQIRLDLAFRGYRMDQVDGVLNRLREELAVRDEEINRLRAQEEPRGDL